MDTGLKQLAGGLTVIPAASVPMPGGTRTGARSRACDAGQARDSLSDCDDTCRLKTPFEAWELEWSGKRGPCAAQPGPG
jgi:hypothetical protein